MKILLILLGCFAFCGLMVAGGVLYVGYKAKQKIDEIKQEYKATNAEAGQSVAPANTAKGGCPFLPAEEVARILGVALERAEHKQSADAETCVFFMSPAERARMARQQMERSVASLSKEKVTDQEAARQVAQLTEGVLNLSGQMAGKGDLPPALQVEVSHKADKAAFESMLGKQTIEGLGDRAFMIPGGLGVFVLKGDASIALTFSFVAGPEKATELAKYVVARIP